MLKQKEQDASGGPGWSVCWLIFVVAFAVYWPLRSDYLCEPDSPGFALAAKEFHVEIGSPHPPGYPLWVLAAACLTRMVGSPNTAMTLLSIGFTAGAAVFLFRLACRLHGSLGAVWIVGLFLLTPNVLLYSAMATTYTVDFFTSCVIGWLTARLWEGEKRLAPRAAAVLGLLAGVRLSGVVLMMPVVICALWVACRWDWRIWLKSALWFAGVFSCWFFPLIYFSQSLSEGIRGFWKGGCELCWLLIGYSFLGGAPAQIHLDRLIRVAIWLAVSLLVPLSVSVCLGCVRKSAKLSRVAAVPRPAWHNGWFYSFWSLPNLLIVSFFHCPKPGYLNLSLPPLLLCLGSLIYADVGVLSRIGKKTRTWPGAVTVSLFLVATTVLASFPFGRISSPGFARFPHVLQMASLHHLRESDQAVSALLGLAMAEQSVLPEQMFITIEQEHFALGPTALHYYFPAYPGCEPGREGLAEVFHGERIQSSVPVQTKRIWWNLPSSLSADRIRTALPETELVLVGDYRSFYLTKIGSRPLDAEIRWGEFMCPLYRPLGVEFARGFGSPETDDWRNSFIWAMGPECDLKIGIERAMPIRVILDVMSSPIPGQEIKVSFNGSDPQALPSVQPGARVPLAFNALEGVNELRLIFGMWNGSPSTFVPADGRPLALSMRQITIELEDGSPAQLLPDGIGGSASHRTPGQPRKGRFH